MIKPSLVCLCSLLGLFHVLSAPQTGGGFSQGFPVPGQRCSIPQEQYFLWISRLDNDFTPCGSNSATAQPLVTAPGQPSSKTNSYTSLSCPYFMVTQILLLQLSTGLAEPGLFSLVLPGALGQVPTEAPPLAQTHPPFSMSLFSQISRVWFLPRTISVWRSCTRSQPRAGRQRSTRPSSS